MLQSETNVFTRAVFCCCALVTGALALAILAHTVVLYMLAAGLMLWVYMRADRAVRQRNQRGIAPAVFIVLLVVASLSIKLFFVFTVHTQPVSDFQLLYSTAQEVARGDVSTLHNHFYFQNWAYQTGFVAWMAFFIKLFGANAVFFQVTNCIFATASTLLIYAIARKLVSERAAQCVGLLYLFTPSQFFLLSVLTNQHLSNLLALLGIYIYIYIYICIKRKPIRRYLWSAALAGLVLALCNAIRPVAIVVVGALLCVELIQFVLAWLKTRKLSLTQLLYPTVMAVVYFGMTLLLSFSVKASGLNPNGLTNQFPLWKFAAGLNYESRGQWSQADASFIFSAPTVAEREANAKELIHTRLSSGPATLLSLAHRKVQAMWVTVDSPSWAFGHITPPQVDWPIVGQTTLLKLLQDSAMGFYCLVFCLFCYACCLLARRKAANPSPLMLLLALLFLFYFGIHLLIEVQQRYRDFGMLFAVIAAAYGLEQILARRNNNTPDP